MGLWKIHTFTIVLQSMIVEIPENKAQERWLIYASLEMKSVYKSTGLVKEEANAEIECK